MSQKALSVLTATALIFGVATSLLAGPQARIFGSVSDSSGNPITSATITLTSQELPSYKNVLEVDDKGKFKALLLDATKTYILSVDAPGFASHKEALKVPVGTTDNEFNISLNTQGELAQEQQQELLDRPGYKQYDEGRKLLEQGNTGAAKLKFEEAVVLVPDLIPAWNALMDMAYESGDNAKALELAKRCLEIDDEALHCLAIAANSSENLNLSEEHQSYMTRYQELNPEDPATLFNQAVEFLNKMDDEGARPLLEQCLEVDGDFPTCLFEYGMLLLRSGETQAAKEKLQRYLDVAPDGPDAATAADTVKWL